MNNPWSLPPRLIEVVQLVAEGHGNREIALHLGISENTVKVHMVRLTERMQANNRTHAAVMWDRLNREQVA